MVKRAVREVEPSARYHTVAHEFLELHNKPVDGLDLLLDEVVATIQPKKHSIQEIPGIINTLDEILTETGVKKKGAVVYVHQERLYNLLGPLVYMAVAEVLDLPFAAVKGRHVLISWNLPEGNYINQIVLPKNHDFEEFDVVSENDNVSERLDKNQILAIYYRNIGKSWGNKGELQRAITCFDKAIELDPQSVYTYHYRGTVYNILGEHEKAKQDICKVYELQ